MLIARIYALMWLLAAAAGSVLYLTDSFSAPASLIFGFVMAFLGGAGILVVFPAVMAERVSPVTAPQKSYNAQKTGRSAKIYGGKQATA